LRPADFVPELEADIEISLAEMTPELLESFRWLEPFGIGNEEPVLIVRHAKLLDVKQIKEAHAKLRLFQVGSRPLEAMAWRMYEQTQADELHAGEFLDVAVRLSENEHPEFGGLQLELLDWKLKREAALTASRS